MISLNFPFPRAANTCIPKLILRPLVPEETSNPRFLGINRRTQTNAGALVLVFVLESDSVIATGSPQSITQVLRRRFPHDNEV